MSLYSVASNMNAVVELCHLINSDLIVLIPIAVWFISSSSQKQAFAITKMSLVHVPFTLFFFFNWMGHIVSSYIMHM